MNDFSHIAAGLRLFSGSASLKALPAELARAKSRRTVVFCGKTVAVSPALCGAVRELLSERCVAVFDGVHTLHSLGYFRCQWLRFRRMRSVPSKSPYLTPDAPI